MLQAVITALPILIIEIDKNGNILDFNIDSPSLFDVNLEDSTAKRVLDPPQNSKSLI